MHDSVAVDSLVSYPNDLTDFVQQNGQRFCLCASCGL